MTKASRQIFVKAPLPTNLQEGDTLCAVVGGDSPLESLPTGKGTPAFLAKLPEDGAAYELRVRSASGAAERGTTRAAATFLGRLAERNVIVEDVYTSRAASAELPEAFQNELMEAVLGVKFPPVERTEIPLVGAEGGAEGAVLVRLAVSAPANATTLQGRRVFAVGSSPLLGKWQPANAVALSCDPDSHVWHADLLLRKADLAAPLEYKFILAGPDRKDVTWEADPNRQITAGRLGESLAVLKRLCAGPGGPEAALAALSLSGAPAPAASADPFSDLSAFAASAAVVHYDSLRNARAAAWRAAGVAAPVFALRSRASCGIGEFPDLQLLADWCRDAGLKLVQILPVNDTTNFHDWHDASPYSAISSFALHPLYIRLQATGSLSPGLLKSIQDAKGGLEKGRLDYTAVQGAKMGLLRRAFEEMRGAQVQDPEYRAFKSANRDWLMPYALFSALREAKKTCDYTAWGAGLVHPTLAEVYAMTSAVDVPPEAAAEEAAPAPAPAPAARACPAEAADVEFWAWAQWHAHRQLLEASRHARARGVGLKGDLPIGVGRFCVDTWVHPELFKMDTSAGAPPDGGSFWGQQWGLPTYDWGAMRAAGFSWWRRRMQHMAQYFDAYRIDHVLGFFRIYEVPGSCVRGLMGRFRPARPLSVAELAAAGVGTSPAELERLSAPFVRRQHVEEAFGGRAGDVLAKWFEAAPAGGDRLRFKPCFDTEEKIFKELDRLPAWATDAERRERDYTLETLLAALGSVVLIPDDEDPKAFHPRFRIQDSRSFAELPAAWKPALAKLADDYCWRRQDATWEASADEKLPMLKAASPMLAFAEDLGMIPACVPRTLDRHSILGLRIQRFPTGPEPFGDPSRYPYGTVCSTSTHDTAPLRLWWERLDASQRQRLLNEVLRAPGPAPQFCEPWLAEKVVAAHMAGSSMWAVFPIQDLMAVRADARRPGHPAEEQINAPELGGPQHNWAFRVHCDLEDLIKNSSFAEHIRRLAAAGGRAT
eukprot:tig00000158_g10211.t1